MAIGASTKFPFTQTQTPRLFLSHTKIGDVDGNDEVGV